MKWFESIQRRKARPSSISSTGKGGGAVSSSAITSATRTRISGQSSTATRTSASTCSIRLRISRPRLAMSTARISICMADSRDAFSGASSGGWIAVIRPFAVRTTATIGWMTRRGASPIPFSASVTESTRKGMSSLTISTTVAGESQPSRARTGLTSRTAAWPGLRDSRKASSDSAAPARSSGAVTDRCSAGARR